VPLIKFTSSEKVMGKFTNKPWVIYLACFMALVLFLINGAGLIPRNLTWKYYAMLSVPYIAYISLIAVVIMAPVKELEATPDE